MKKHLLLFSIMIAIALSGTIVFAQDYRRYINLEWEPIEGAISYDVEIKPIKNDTETKAVVHKVKGADWTGPLSPGNYTLKIRGRDKRKVPGPWGDVEQFTVGLEPVSIIYPKANSNIQSKDESKDKIAFNWTPLKGATKYVVEIQSEDEKIKIEETVKKPPFQVKLPVAQKFTWKVTAYNDENFSSDSTSINPFILMGPQLSSPSIQSPPNGFVRELNWSKPENAEAFEYALQKFDPKSKKWEPVEKNKTDKNQLGFGKENSGGKYKLAVRANANYRPSSKISEMQFNVVSGDRSPAAEETATIRESIDRTTGWFAIFSYLVTQISYKGENYDSSTGYAANIPSAMGGTGRVGAGYLAETTPWGFLGIVDYSGFYIDSKVYNFASLEGNGIYRVNLGTRGELRHQFGGFYKDLPYLSVQGATASTTEKVTAMGPHYGLEYWYAINSKFGFQANLHTYLSLISLKTPNGNKASPDLSYQLGLLGSYRLNRKMTGLGGYAYKVDSLSFDSTTGKKNKASITGHYLNLFLEWAL
ncbi:MAG: hypothetical protein BroJett040_25960 [Oligoflexia bacterium]|nr:MAG: hypothetical protein BroJett040_25960 [Oligoflexia bacterium]